MLKVFANTPNTNIFHQICLDISCMHCLAFQGTIGFDGTILENDQSWLITMATLTNIPRRAVGIVRLKQPENLGPGR